MSVQLAEITGRSPTSYVDQLTDELCENVLAAKEDLYDPISNFINNAANVRICNDTDRFLKDSNLGQMPEGTNREVTDLRNSPELYRAGNVKKLETALKKLKENVAAFVKSERSAAEGTIMAETDQLTKDERYGKLSPADRDQLMSRPKALLAALAEDNSVQHIHTVTAYFVDKEMSALWAQLAKMAEPVPPPPPEKKGDDDGPKPPAPSVEYARVEDLLDGVKSAKPTIESEAELDAYLQNVRAVLRSSLSKGIRIRVKAK